MQVEPDPGRLAPATFLQTIIPARAQLNSVKSARHQNLCRIVKADMCVTNGASVADLGATRCEPRDLVLRR